MQTFFLRDKRLKYALISLLVWYAAAFYWVYPHNLAYFNELVGGPQKGPYYLNDSNVDWGQEMPGLQKWMDRNSVNEIILYYFGNGEPGYWGINYIKGTFERITNPSPGYYAVSAHILAVFRMWHRVYGWDTDWLGKYKPVGRVGYSVYIYKF